MLGVPLKSSRFGQAAAREVPGSTPIIVIACALARSQNLPACGINAENLLLDGPGSGRTLLVSSRRFD
jgi:hypothetical protein